MKKVILYFAFLIAQCSFLVSPAGAQGMVSEIKVFALNEYKELADKESNVIFGGRLGTYKYYNMDQIILEALETADRELKK